MKAEIQPNEPNYEVQPNEANYEVLSNLPVVH
jgi:hypothetical protein